MCSSIFLSFSVYTMHESVSNILVTVRELSEGIINPCMWLHGIRHLQISPGPWHSRLPVPEQGKYYLLKYIIFSDLKTYCFNEKLKETSI